MSEQVATRLPMITSARVGFTKVKVQELVFKDKKKVFELFHVVGSATQAVPKESKDYDDKESIEFRGSFMAVNPATGETFKSGKLYLPSVVEAEIAAAVQRSGLVELAVTVTAEFNEKAGTSYVYGIKSYGKEDNSTFDGLLRLIPGMAKALPAPDEDESDAEVSEAKGGKGTKGGKGGRKR